LVEASKRWQRDEGVGLVGVVVVPTIVEVVVEAVVDLLQTLAKLTSPPSLEL
jgi:hypothetical protein